MTKNWKENVIAFLPKMTGAFTAWFQTLAWIAQAIDLTTLPEPYRTRVGTAVGFIIMFQAIMAHHYAPNGQKLTPGSPPYVPPPDPAPTPAPPSQPAAPPPQYPVCPYCGRPLGRPLPRPPAPPE